MKTTIKITLHEDTLTIEEKAAEEKTFLITGDSWEEAIWDIGEAVKDYLEGLN